MDLNEGAQRLEVSCSPKEIEKFVGERASPLLIAGLHVAPNVTECRVEITPLMAPRGHVSSVVLHRIIVQAAMAHLVAGRQVLPDNGQEIYLSSLSIRFRVPVGASGIIQVVVRSDPSSLSDLRVFVGKVSLATGVEAANFKGVIVIK